MIPSLRLYQDRVIQETRAHAHESPIVVLPTGAGKSVVAAEMMRLSVAMGYRAGFIVHRKELVEQAAGHVRNIGVEPGIIMAGVRETASPIQVCSTLSLLRRGPRDLDLLLYDEVHHSPSASGQKVLELYPDATRIGFTATPARLDGRGLKEAGWGHLVIGPTTRGLIEKGYLADFKYFGVPGPRMDDVPSRGGDYQKGAAAKRMKGLVGRVPDHYREYLFDGRAIVFAVTVEHSKAIQKELAGSGISAEHADAKTPKRQREAIMDRFRSGETRVLCQVQLVDEGFDVPECDGVILARPTQSLTFHRQSCGRALRPKPDGSHAVIIDMAGNWQRLGLPDENVEWSLEGRTRVAARQPWRTCPQCFAVVPIGKRVCILCGHEHVPEKRPGPTYRPGRLREIKKPKRRKGPSTYREKDAERRGHYYRELRHAMGRGSKIMAARLAYKRRMGRWPAGMADLEDEVRKECTHAQIQDGVCRFCEQKAGLFA